MVQGLPEIERGSTSVQSGVVKLPAADTVDAEQVTHPPIRMMQTDGALPLRC